MGQPLSNIVDITVSVGPVSAPRPTFDRALIVGTSTAISAADRVKIYQSADAMISDGFDNDDPEYLAALIYFGQSPRPDYLIVGRQDTAAEVPETCLQAITACRAKNSDWYIGICLAAVKADHEAIALWAESAQPSTVYFGTTADATVAAGTDGNLAANLKADLYDRTLTQYSTQANAVVAIAGYAMGANSGTANSAYTLKFKTEVGITPEDLTPTEITTIEGNNCNIYTKVGPYNMFEQGVMASGRFFDEVLGIDILISDIQLNVMDVLKKAPKVPQTDSGAARIMRAISQAGDKAVTRGFLAPGMYRGDNILNLKTDDFLPMGYLVQYQPLSEQSDADRAARKSPPFYVSVVTAGAMHSFNIAVYVS